MSRTAPVDITAQITIDECFTHLPCLGHLAAHGIIDKAHACNQELPRLPTDQQRVICGGAASTIPSNAVRLELCSPISARDGSKDKRTVWPDACLGYHGGISSRQETALQSIFINKEGLRNRTETEVYLLKLYVERDQDEANKAGCVLQ
eukprot:TRINITY_DN9836_c0_g1_i2.p1 TRINITY_DN9836_c0_g1~~TRINITY_DN9836_c0_g1_i2.p1  ORF type:complete len:149 (+),score=18.15 TRINITY_DN9836_c0_g1_i2:47-493(+)